MSNQVQPNAEYTWIEMEDRIFNGGKRE